MSDFADFTVPTFAGFNMEPEHEEVETYFEYNHESNYLTVSETNSSTGDESETKWHPSEDIIFGEVDNEIAVSEEVAVRYSRRRSMSTGDLTALDNPKIKNEPMSPMIEEERSFPASLQKHKSLSRLTLKHNKGEQYVSVAEKMNRFWSATPERFRSQPRINNGSRHIVAKTVPKTPNLSTKNRSRAVTTVSWEQQQEIEMEEARRHQVKAHPVNMRVLQDPKLMPVHKKPVTQVKPFNLTEMQTKKNGGPMKATVPLFHAKPVPKSVYEQPKDLRPVPPKMVVPKVMKRSTSKDRLPQDSNTKPRPNRTEPKPFSFDTRDKEITRKREELVNKVLEEEKKAREFHARPIPKSIAGKGRNASTSSIRSTQSEDSTDSNNYKPKVFKATSPKVLHQKPFIPKKMERVFVEVTDFQLNTQLRARDRAEFDAQKREKEEQAQQWRVENEIRQKQIQLEEITKLRKEMEHKAQPIRKFKQLPELPPPKVTVAKSPKFLSGKSNKENRN